MKRIGIGAIIAVLCASTSFAQPSIDAQGIADGKTVLWFSGTQVTVKIVSGFSIEGSLELEGETIHFTAEGSAYGEGIGDSSTLMMDVWLILEATGVTADGTPISIRGGMAGSSEDADLTGNVLGSATGPFFAVVTLGAESFRAIGSGEGSASGAFVAPEVPQTMQINGVATYHLTGDLVADDQPTDEDAAPDYLAHLPWDPESWPAELLALFLDVLCGTGSIPTELADESRPEETPAEARD